MKDLVELEVRELLESYGFPSDYLLLKVLLDRLYLKKLLQIRYTFGKNFNEYSG